MKTNMNINRIAQMSIASAALFFFANVMPVKAEIKSDVMNNPEVSAATCRLDNLNNEIEVSIRFVAPTISTNDETMTIEAEAAAERLEILNNSIEKSAKFVAPAVDVNAEAVAGEIAQAVERLESLNVTIEDSIRFQAPVSL
jgi:hypothetical protein